MSWKKKKEKKKENDDFLCFRTQFSKAELKSEDRFVLRRVRALSSVLPRGLRRQGALCLTKS